MDDFDPRSWRRRSRALCRFCPDRDRDDFDSKRCDSLSRRCRARSFLRFSASVAASLEPTCSSLFNLTLGEDWLAVDGGFVDLERHMVSYHFLK